VGGEKDLKGQGWEVFFFEEGRKEWGGRREGLRCKGTGMGGISRKEEMGWEERRGRGSVVETKKRE
jgi:hypothetical protein